MGHSLVGALALLVAFAPPAAAGDVAVDVNQPECDPIGENWYDSTKRCLDELCGTFN